MSARPGLVLGLTASAAALLLAPRSPGLLWNATASVPIGLYSLGPAGRLTVGELVVIDPPPPLAAQLAARHALPRGVPLLKPVAAVAGQVVCRTGAVIAVDGQRLGRALIRDRQGRALPRWSGCHRLASSQVFVMNPAAADSFDGRYFGPLPVTAVRARARPVWRIAGPALGAASGRAAPPPPAHPSGAFKS